MSIRKTPWKWTKARELAARLVAEDRLPDRGIAEQAGVSEPTIYVWRAKPEFMARVDELVAAYRKRSGRASIAAVEKRIANMVRDLDLLDQVDAERARVYGSDRFRDAVPGGATGKVIVTSYQVITDPRTGRKQEVPITAVDTDAVHVKLAILKRVAQVLGQRGKSVESAGADRLNELVEIVKRGAAPAPQGTDCPGGGGGAGSPTGNPEAGDAEPRAVGGEGRVSVMPIKKIPWKWTKKRELAARLVAEDELPDCEIAQKVGVSQPTIYVWRAKPEFMARVDELVAAYRKQIRITSIGLVENRIARMDRELELLKQVEAERARVYGADRFRDAIPGGGTGLIVIKRYQRIADPMTGRTQNVPITAMDTAVQYAEMAILKQAAQDLGQWGKKGDSDGADRLNELIENAKRGAAPALAPQCTDYCGV
jgi:transposase